MSSVYASDPHGLPDSAFAPGTLGHLVAGNRGRLLDARRTPVTVVGVSPDRGSFSVQVDAFEDAGSQWELGLEEIIRFQFAADAEKATADALAELERSAAHFDRELVVECDPAVRQETRERLAEYRAEAAIRLAGVEIDLAGCVERREGAPALYDLLEEYAAQHGFADLESAFAAAFVTNPRAGEIVKGHAIVLAELGLCPYRGRIPRDAELFEGAGARSRRAEHLLRRLAFSQALLRHLGAETLTLYRAAATDAERIGQSQGSFVSATFSREVAEAHFEGGPTTRAAAMWSRAVPVDRVLMTFLDTRAMNERFREAEAILIGGATDGSF